MLLIKEMQTFLKELYEPNKIDIVWAATAVNNIIES